MKYITIKTNSKGKSEIVAGPEEPGAIHRKAVRDARGTLAEGQRIAMFSLRPEMAATGGKASPAEAPEPEPKKAKV